MTKELDKEIQEKLAKKYACYVLITCDSPSNEGKMKVEMSYEGDPVLASYLLQGAQGFLEEQDSGEEETLNG